MNLADFSLRNRTTTMVLAMVLIGAGIISFNGLARLEDPEFTIKEALVITPLSRRNSRRGGKGGQ